MKIDPNSTVPVFKQIVAEMQSAIAAGIFREGEAIPSARVLSLRLNVNPNTIQRAFEELDHLGVIETRRGIGKFVTRGALKNAAKKTKQEILRVFKEGIRKANAAGMPRAEVDSIYQAAIKSITVKTSGSQK